MSDIAKFKSPGGTASFSPAQDGAKLNPLSGTYGRFTGCGRSYICAATTAGATLMTFNS
jgi:hypothetical protein